MSDCDKSVNQHHPSPVDKRTTSLAHDEDNEGLWHRFRKWIGLNETGSVEEQQSHQILGGECPMSLFLFLFLAKFIVAHCNSIPLWLFLSASDSIMFYVRLSLGDNDDKV